MKTIEYLKNIIALGLTEKQQEYYDFLLENGKTFEVRADHFGGLEHVKEKQCFNNSFLTAIRNGLEYWEGFYICEDIPIPLEHAFNKKGKSNFVIDTTAQKFEIPVEEWFGVKIPNWVLCEWFNGDQYLTPLQYYFRFKLEIKNISKNEKTKI